MTTIAWDGKLLCGDGRSDMSDVILSNDKQKIMRAGDTFYGFAGSRTLFAPIIEWLEAGGVKSGPVPKVDDGSWQCLIVGRQGVRYAAVTCVYPLSINGAWAIGSGMQFAIAAMRAGADARRAVQIACELDPWSGGDIQVIDIAEALGLNQIQQAAE